MKKMTYVIITLGILLIIWTVASFMFERSIETPEYTVLEQKKGYEIRQYDSYIAAQTTVVGDTYSSALGDGFRVLADYIFGNNTTRVKMDMTAPVSSKEDAKSEAIKMTAPVSVEESENIEMTAPVSVETSEQIKMTAPVSETSDGVARIISFVMPKKYTLDTLPLPNNPNVSIVTVPARTVAVSHFSWYASEARVQAQKEKLFTLLERDAVQTIGTPIYAGYNAPFNAPWLNKHEIMIEVEPIVSSDE